MGKLDISKMQDKRDELAERSKGGGSYEFYKIKDGDQVLRILPPKGDKTEFWKEAKIHFNVGGTGAVHCLKQFGKKCPVCEEVAKLSKSKSKEDQKLAKKMRASTREYINIIERNSKDHPDEVQVMDCGPTVLQKILDCICNPDYGDVTDFNEGIDLTINRKGKDLDTTYSVLPKRKESIATTKMAEKELDEALPDLDSLVVEKSKEEILAMLDGETVTAEDAVVDDEDVEKVDAEIVDENDIEAQIRAELEKNK